MTAGAMVIGGGRKDDTPSHLKAPGHYTGEGQLKNDGTGVRYLHGFERAVDDQSPVDIVLVNQLLERRNDAKRNRDFAESDRIRDTLKQINIDVQDRDRVWRVCGAGNVGKGAGGADGFWTYRRDDDGSIAVDEQKVEDLLSQRNDAKRNRDFPRADRIRDELSQMGVMVHGGHICNHFCNHFCNHMYMCTAGTSTSNSAHLYVWL